ncbi:MAG: ABC transporter permease [Thermomicrobiales bacterium]
MPRGVWTVTVAHATMTLCYAAVVIQARLIGFDRTLEEAALDLGLHARQAFLEVTLPNIAPAVAAAWMLAFTLSLDDLVIASFTSGPGSTTLPMRIYSQVRLGVSPEINAVSTLLIGLVATGVIADLPDPAAPAGRRLERRHLVEPGPWPVRSGPARRKRVASSAIRPTNWMPIGRPSARSRPAACSCRAGRCC